MLTGQRQSRQSRSEAAEESAARRRGWNVISFLAAIALLGIAIQVVSPHSAYNERGTTVKTSVQ